MSEASGSGGSGPVVPRRTKLAAHGRRPDGHKPEAQAGIPGGSSTDAGEAAHHGRSRDNRGGFILLFRIGQGPQAEEETVGRSEERGSSGVAAQEGPRRGGAANRQRVERRCEPAAGGEGGMARARWPVAQLQQRSPRRGESEAETGSCFPFLFLE